MCCLAQATAMAKVLTETQNILKHNGWRKQYVEKNHNPKKTKQINFSMCWAAKGAPHPPPPSLPKNLSHTRLKETICRKSNNFQDDTVSINPLEICFACVLFVFAPCPPCPMLTRQRQDATTKKLISMGAHAKSTLDLGGRGGRDPFAGKPFGK